MTRVDFVISPMREADVVPVLALLAQSGLPQDGLAGPGVVALVARDDQSIIGSAALELYGPAALLRSVAVAGNCRGQGLGQKLTLAALELARSYGVERVYLLTETAVSFFPRFGFEPVERAVVDPAVQRSVEFVSVCPVSAVAMRLKL